jgi:phosphoesterase RecJ-like protein
MPTAAAAAQLCFYLIRELGWDVDEPAATALLTGLVTDTGRFQYSNTTPEVLRVAAELVAAGARPELIGQRVYESVPFGYLGLSGEVVKRAVLERDRKFIWSSMTQEDLRRHGIDMTDTDPLIDAVRVAREADVAALIKELPGGLWKVSLRSRGRVDVSAIAGRFGGGGHHNASGFTFEGSAEQAATAVRDLLP